MKIVNKILEMEKITLAHLFLITFLVLFLYDIIHAKENSISCALTR